MYRHTLQGHFVGCRNVHAQWRTSRSHWARKLTREPVGFITCSRHLDREPASGRGARQDSRPPSLNRHDAPIKLPAERQIAACAKDAVNCQRPVPSGGPHFFPESIGDSAAGFRIVMGQWTFPPRVGGWTDERPIVAPGRSARIAASTVGGGSGELGPRNDCRAWASNSAATRSRSAASPAQT